MTRARWWPVFPLLLAAHPVLSLYALNVDQVRFDSVVPALGISIAAAAALTLISWPLFGDPVKGSVVIASCEVIFFVYVPLYLFLRKAAVPFLGLDRSLDIFRHRHLIPMAVLVPVMVAVVVKKGERLRRAVPFLNAIALLLMAMPLVTALQQNWGTMVASTTGFDDLEAPTARPRTLRDIYYIILDAYGSERLLKNRSAYDNHEFVEFLARKGFYVAPESRTNYPITRFSLSSSLNMDYLSRLEGRPDVTVDLIESNRVERFLKAMGYTIVRFPTWWVGTKRAPFADVRFESRAKLWSEFNETLLEMTMLGPFIVFRREAERTHTLYVFDKLQNMPPLGKPMFVFVHILCPREPFVFDRDGNRREDGETRWRYDDPRSMDRYVDQVVFVNRKVEQLVDSLISRSKVPPIIIIQGDHGPTYSDERQKRGYFGILNAYYLPDGGAEKLYPSITPVNSFRMILDYYFGTHLGLLEDRSYLFGSSMHSLHFHQAAESEE